MRSSSLFRTSFLVVLLLGSSRFAAYSQDTSTQEERAQWAVTSHQLEGNPLDNAASARGDAALQRITDVRDFHVSLCQGYFEEFRGLHYTYQHAILRQYMLAAAAFQVEHPDKAGDYFATNLYAVESVLKTYNTIVAAKPDEKSKALDSMEKRQTEGKLDDDVRKQCH
jgi:hypothetical protein